MINRSDEMLFLDGFGRVTLDVHATNEEKGFNEADKRVVTDEQRHARIGLKLALISGELSEALEAVRKDLPGEHIPEFSGFEEELADAVIRIMNLAYDTSARLGQAIIAKAAYNATREKMHGRKKF